MSAEAVAGSDLGDLFDTAPAYSTTEAAELCGLPFQTLHRLAAAGVIASSVPATGYGSKRRWSALEVDRLQRLGDVYRQAHDAGLLLTFQAVASIWAAMTAGTAWRLVLAA
jgi:hypothetical protein